MRYRLSEADYLAANRQHSALLWRSPRALAMPLSVGAIWAFLVALHVAGGWVWHMLTLVGLTLLFATGLWLLMLVVNAIFMPRQARRLYRQTRSLQDDYDVTWDDAELSFVGERSHQRLRWSDFVKWSDGIAGLMFYASDGMFYSLPRRYLSEDAAATVRSALFAHGVPEWRRWRRLPAREVRPQ